MGAETSPVNAASLCESASWPEMTMLVCFVASTAVEMAVKGGAMTMSQCFASATRGRNEEKNARVSARVLYIFQLPAIRRRRLDSFILLFCPSQIPDLFSTKKKRIKHRVRWKHRV